MLPGLVRLDLLRPVLVLLDPLRRPARLNSNSINK
jgi:hypothetical protein